MAEHQARNLEVAGSTPVPLQAENLFDRARKRPPTGPREAGECLVGRRFGDGSTSPLP